MGQFPVRFGRQKTLSRALVAIIAGLASMRDKLRANFDMDSRTSSARIRVQYLVQLRQLCICVNLTNSFFASLARNELF